MPTKPTSVDPFAGTADPGSTKPFPGATRTHIPTRAAYAALIAVLKFVVDVTASMDSIRNLVVSTMHAAVDECVADGVNLQPGLVFVRDIPDLGWAKGLIDHGMQTVADFKRLLAAEGTITNTTHDESQLDGVLCAARTPWPGLKPGRIKHVVLVTNSGTHLRTMDGVNLDQAVATLLKEGVRVHIIGPTNIDAYKRLTNETGGLLFSIDDLSTDYFRQVMETIGKTVTATTFAN